MKKTAAAILITLITSIQVLAGPYSNNSSYPVREGGFIWIIVIVLSAYVIYLTYKNHSASAAENRDNPADVIGILNRRLAKGEISEDHYNRLRGRISG